MSARGRYSVCLKDLSCFGFRDGANPVDGDHAQHQGQDKDWKCELLAIKKNDRKKKKEQALF
jgi:hypothetical protein